MFGTASLIKGGWNPRVSESGLAFMTVVTWTTCTTCVEAASTFLGLLALVPSPSARSSKPSPAGGSHPLLLCPRQRPLIRSVSCGKDRCLLGEEVGLGMFGDETLLGRGCGCPLLEQLLKTR